MLKKMFCMICSFLFFCGCIVPTQPPEPIVYLDKPLEEIIIYGTYYPEDRKKRKELIKELTEKEPCYENNLCLSSPVLYSDETLEEALNGRFATWGKESFSYSESYYCYNETEDKGYRIRRNLKARLYNKEGELLSEGFLRLRKDSHYNHYSVSAYLPHHEEGDKIVFVRLEGKKEKVFYEDEHFMSKEKLIRENIRVYTMLPHLGFQYQEDIQCHTGR